MKKLTLLLLCLSVAASAQTQSAGPPQESPVDYFNDFANFTQEKSFDADSALYNARKLASNERYVVLLSDLIHNSFAQAFIQYPPDPDTSPERVEKRKRATIQHRELLAMMVKDTNARLRAAVEPISLWTEAQEKQDDPASLISLSRKFLDQYVASKDSYGNHLDRYGLLIYQLISGKEELKPVATKFFGTIKENLRSNQITATDSSSRPQLDKRAYYRYLHAYVNYLEANATPDATQKEVLLKNAFDYSPDLIDKNHNAAYFYDMGFLNPGKVKESFQDDYLDYLTNHTKDKNRVLTTLREMALGNPSYKEKLQEYYETHHPEGKGFGQYWQEAVNGSAKTAPPISLALLDKAVFSSKKLAGKWILVDFWGTWCLPCRKEHPDLQKFYDSTVVRNPEKISLLTIACRDTQPKVLAYMAQKNFTFPVAMSDNKIQETYVVQGYPTKILITPEGKYVTVPFNVDWVGFVKKYSDL